MKKWIKNNLDKFSGSILISNQDEILVNEGFKFADKEDEIKNISETKFLIGSVSKMFTSVAIMKLYEEKALDINDSVNKYLNITSLENDIKIVNLLNHTSGLKNFVMFSKKFDLYQDNSPNYIATEICNMKRNFKVGKKFSYTNTGYLMLAMVIEKVTGLKFEEYIEKNIFSPLEMNDSGFISRNVNAIAKGYNKGRESKIFHPSAFFGCGDIISKTSDLKKFIYSFNKGEIINKSLVDEIKKVSASSKMGSYGYGVMVSDKLGEIVIGHGGSVPNSFSAQVSYYEDRNLLIIVLCNDVRSIKKFVPSVMISQYIERLLYEKITNKKLKTMDKLIF
ncbi:serine hydrolase domain-containing protein [Clostridium sp.]|uniref:serine hydrolase domain-containing protein n=1 Tax=Clostridium sp. TaxID=1506 RepID=UPI003F356C0C